MKIGTRHNAAANSKRIKLFGFALGAVFAVCFSAEAQQPKKVPRIGILTSGTPSFQSERTDVFRQGLRDLGYVEGENILIEERRSEGKQGENAALAAELVRLKVDCIVTTGTNPTQAAKNATSTTPIIMTFVSDPVGFGFVMSLARPGRNITGLTNLAPELSGKWLELLKEVIPRTFVVAVLLDPATSIQAVLFKNMLVPAKALGMKLQSLETGGPDGLERTLATLKKQRADALVVLVPPSTLLRQQRILDFTARNRLPAMYHWREYVDAGGLAFYGASVADMYRRAATYVDKILKGRKPADLPVEQPTKFELVINLKAAKQIGLTIPPNVLARADKVIK
jgi:ABC-type uncharacterized transport system substrate-binding protein